MGAGGGWWSRNVKQLWGFRPNSDISAQVCLYLVLSSISESPSFSYLVFWNQKMLRSQKPWPPNYQSNLSDWSPSRLYHPYVFCRCSKVTLNPFNSPRDELIWGRNKPLLTVEEEVRMKEWGVITILSQPCSGYPKRVEGIAGRRHQTCLLFLHSLQYPSSMSWKAVSVSVNKQPSGSRCK